MRQFPSPTHTLYRFYVSVEENEQFFSLYNQGIQNGGRAFQGGPGCVPPRTATNNEVSIA